MEFVLGCGLGGEFDGVLVLRLWFVRSFFQEFLLVFFFLERVGAGLFFYLLLKNCYKN